jgi:hypothetical protein
MSTAGEGLKDVKGLAGHSRMPIILAEALVTFYLLLLKSGLISTDVQNGVIKSPGYSSTLYPKAL